MLLLAFSSAVHGTGLENTAEVDAACSALLSSGPDEPVSTPRGGGGGGGGGMVCVCMLACVYACVSVCEYGYTYF